MDRLSSSIKYTLYLYNCIQFMPEIDMNCKQIKKELHVQAGLYRPPIRRHCFKKHLLYRLACLIVTGLVTYPLVNHYSTISSSSLLAPLSPPLDY